MMWSEASRRPGLVGEQAAYTSCMYSALLRNVSRLVIHTPDTMWSCSDKTDCLSTVTVTFNVTVIVPITSAITVIVTVAIAMTVLSALPC